MPCHHCKHWVFPCVRGKLTQSSHNARRLAVLYFQRKIWCLWFGSVPVTMPSNVEIKAKVDDVEALKRLVEERSGQKPTVILQRDTFFQVASGRLKLRFLQDSPSQLIFYKRNDSSGPKHSEYHVSETLDPESLQNVLGEAIGIRGEVRKTRLLYMVGQTRVQVDSVEGLGDFMELEVQMRDDQTLEEGQTIAEALMVDFGIANENLISCAYMDLLENKSC